MDRKFVEQFIDIEYTSARQVAKTIKSLLAVDEPIVEHPHDLSTEYPNTYAVWRGKEPIFGVSRSYCPRARSNEADFTHMVTTNKYRVVIYGQSIGINESSLRAIIKTTLLFKVRRVGEDFQYLLTRVPPIIL